LDERREKAGETASQARFFAKPETVKICARQFNLCHQRAICRVFISTLMTQIRLIYTVLRGTEKIRDDSCESGVYYREPLFSPQHFFPQIIAEKTCGKPQILIALCENLRHFSAVICGKIKLHVSP